MSLHVGNLIKKIFKEKGWSMAEFARRLPTSRENMYTLLKKESMDTKLLQMFCEVMEHNFFAYFKYDFVSPENASIVKEPDTEYLSKKDVELEELKWQLEIMNEEIEYLKQVNKLLAKRKKKTP